MTRTVNHPRAEHIAMAAKQKLTIYMPDSILDELKVQAERQDRSISWLVEHCWKLARPRVSEYPGVNDAFDAAG